MGFLIFSWAASVPRRSSIADIIAGPNRRDDLESLGYLLVFLYSGSLPWDELADQASVEQLGRCKAATDVGSLCDAQPPEFERYLREVRGLGFEQRPDYASLQGSIDLLSQHRGSFARPVGAGCTPANISEQAPRICEYLSNIARDEMTDNMCRRQ